MKNHSHQRGRALLASAAPLALALTALLGACSNNDYDDDQIADQERRGPASATGATGAWTAFAAAQAPSDSLEPLDLTGVEPPLSETEEGRAI
ncbi:MAG: hypothetical protein LH480_07150 [Rubrivivax sp.]|nr:hypothetical protein [Rubrivivax sp.]